MNLQTIASHTVDLDLIRHSPILDVGCRWFDFPIALCKAKPNTPLTLKCVDPARDVIRDYDVAGQIAHAAAVRGEYLYSPEIEFLQYALIGDAVTDRRRLAHFSTGEGDFLTPLEKYYDAEMYEVACINIDVLMSITKVQRWDLVKLDCEGSEFGILENWPGPIASQISVEFHDWDKPSYRSETYYDGLWKKLPWYKVVKHELSRQGDGVGHWDSLLVLR